MSSARCTYCACPEGHLKFVSLPCCHSVIHSVCMEWLMRDVGRICVDCLTPLPQNVVDEVQILQKCKETCTICQEEVVCTEKYLSCSHWFHADCLVGMIEEGRRTCPNCRVPIVDPHLFVLETKLHHRKCKAMRSLLASELFMFFEEWAQQETRRVVQHTYVMPDVDTVDPEWSAEKVLTAFYLDNAYQISPRLAQYVMIVINSMHKCDFSCENHCLVSRWRRMMQRRRTVITLD